MPRLVGGQHHILFECRTTGLTMYPVKKIILIVLAVAAAFLSCASVERVSVLLPDGSQSFLLMDFRTPFSMDALPEGWYHRKFKRHSPMALSFVTRDNRPSLRVETDDSASMLFRHVDVDLDSYPILSWDWFIEKAIDSSIDERTFKGDDHPARLFLKFEDDAGKQHSMELIWGNSVLKSGDWKHLKMFGLYSFPHYVANGGMNNVGQWHHESVDLREIYQKLWGDSRNVHLIDIAIFCDTDETGTQSIAYFSDIAVERAP